MLLLMINAGNKGSNHWRKKFHTVTRVTLTKNQQRKHCSNIYIYVPSTDGELT